MYGTVARLSPLPGREQEIIALLQDWHRKRAPTVQGFRDAYLLRPENHPQDLIMVAIFESKAAYVANADDPAQDAWYRQLRTLLRADPQWEDADCLLASPQASRKAGETPVGPS